MANIYPTQTRTIDPYSSYASDNVNKFTRLVTNNQNCIYSTHSIDVFSDPTNPNTSILISTGQCFKDDVLISIDDQKQVDMSNINYYVSGPAWNEQGYYYVLLEYTYTKSRPAPKASIKILKPSQRSIFETSDAYLFLKAVYVSFNGSTFEIETLHDYDPENPDNRRIYSPLFAGVEDYLPTFNQNDHEGKIIYVRKNKLIYWGTNSGWEEFSSIRAPANTQHTDIGTIGYFSDTGFIEPAIATNYSTFANCITLTVGEQSDGSGNVRLYGMAYNVKVEPGINIVTGQTVYLSPNVAGTCTNVKPPLSNEQIIGRAISDSNSSMVNIWFQPGLTNLGGIGKGDYYEEEQIYYFMLDDSYYRKVYYDVFNEPETITRGGDPLPEYQSSFTRYYGEPGGWIQQTVISGSETYKRFHIHLETSVGTDILIQYSINNGMSWVDTTSDVDIIIPSGFNNLSVKFSWQNIGYITSFGVFYQSMIASMDTTSANVFYIYDVQTATSGQTDFNMTTVKAEPGKHKLLAFVDGLFKIPNIDFIEVNEDLVRFSSPMSGGEKVTFLKLNNINIPAVLWE